MLYLKDIVTNNHGFRLCIRVTRVNLKKSVLDDVSCIMNESLFILWLKCIRSHKL